MGTAYALRGMISYRQRLVKTGTMIRNRLHSLLHRHNLLLPEEGLANKTWWDRQALSALEKIQIHREIALLEQIDQHKAEVDAELGRLCLGEVWGKPAVRLLQLSGFGVIVTMTVLSAIGDVSRFESSNKLVGYSGLGAGVCLSEYTRRQVHDSGKEHIEKRITKSGRTPAPWRAVPGKNCAGRWWKRHGVRSAFRRTGRNNTKNTCAACANPIKRSWSLRGSCWSVFGRSYPNRWRIVLQNPKRWRRRC